ncbi:hypothetical protein NPIL_670041 [Nephila pilipes]|uniref:Uncharacterized protein n=1 Tax=Nephila pilipes TaxID=299642 RepID=A0A8X6URD0_NEPPI|nr:hypothetical protein NPIL_670041 [Nephila pilipes]
MDYHDNQNIGVNRSQQFGVGEKYTCSRCHVLLCVSRHVQRIFALNCQDGFFSPYWFRVTNRGSRMLQKRKTSVHGIEECIKPSSQED